MLLDIVSPCSVSEYETCQDLHAHPRDGIRSVEQAVLWLLGWGYEWGSKERKAQGYLDENSREPCLEWSLQFRLPNPQPEESSRD